MLIADHLGAGRKAMGVELEVCLVSCLDRLIHPTLGGRVKVGRHLGIVSTFAKEPEFISIIRTLSRMLHFHGKLEYTALVDAV